MTRGSQSRRRFHDDPCKDPKKGPKSRAPPRPNPSCLDTSAPHTLALFIHFLLTTSSIHCHGYLRSSNSPSPLLSQGLCMCCSRSQPMSRSVSAFTSSLTCHLLRSLPKKPPHYSISLSCFIPSALSSLLICLLIYLFVCLTTRHKPHEGMNVFLVTAMSSDRAWQILGAN